MFCTHCGKPIENDVRFCTACGTATGMPPSSSTGASSDSEKATRDPTWPVLEVSRIAKYVQWLPPIGERVALEPGDIAKIPFEVGGVVASASRVRIEQLWVEIVSGSGGTYVGRLLTEPRRRGSLSPGAMGPFTISKILDFRRTGERQTARERHVAGVVGESRYSEVRSGTVERAALSSAISTILGPGAAPPTGTLGLNAADESHGPVGKKKRSVPLAALSVLAAVVGVGVVIASVQRHEVKKEIVGAEVARGSKREEASATPPREEPVSRDSGGFKATFSCSVPMAGQQMPLLGCMMGSGIKVRSGGSVTIYDALAVGSLPTLTVPLSEHFTIEARNTGRSQFMILEVRIVDSAGIQRYHDQTSPGGSIGVQN